MSDRTKRPRTQLQPHEPTPEHPDAGVLERITDPLAREIYRKKLELGIEVCPYKHPPPVHNLREWEDR